MKNTNLETSVGLFLLFGIGIVCTLVLFFGQVEGLFKPSNELIVRFSNASGLLKGSDVFLSGAAIGKVVTDPYPIPDTQKVEVRIKVDKSVIIREGAEYVIGSAGLLGDKYIEVKPHEYPDGTPEEDKKPPVHNGQTIDGTHEATISDLTSSATDLTKDAKPLIEKATDIAAQADQMMRRLNLDIFSGTGPGTSPDDMKQTIQRIREIADNSNKMILNANDILDQVKNSKGLLGRIINDRKTNEDVGTVLSNLKIAAANMKDLSFNLKAHGVLFYHDDIGEAQKEKQQESDERKRK